MSTIKVNSRVIYLFKLLTNYVFLLQTESTPLHNSQSYLLKENILIIISGSYNADNGQAACKQCSPGTYQDAIGRTSCAICQPGYKCPTKGIFSFISQITILQIHHFGVQTETKENISPNIIQEWQIRLHVQQTHTALNRNQQNAHHALVIKRVKHVQLHVMKIIVNPVNF